MSMDKVKLCLIVYSMSIEHDTLIGCPLYVYDTFLTYKYILSNDSLSLLQTNHVNVFVTIYYWSATP